MQNLCCRFVGTKAGTSSAVVMCISRRSATTSPKNPSSTSSSAAAEVSSSDTAGRSRKLFTSAVKFDLPADQVNETNAPSAKEVAARLPTLEQLRQQLPSARELERQYVDGPAKTPPAPTAEDLVSDQSDCLTDPVEGTLDEMDAAKMGEGGAPQPTAQHVSLAFRALWWGTVYAVGGFIIAVALGMAACGYTSPRQLLDAIRAKNERDLARVRQEAAASGNGEVVHYVLDISNPTELVATVITIWDKVQELAEEANGETGNK